MKPNQLVQHTSVTFLARVVGPDPSDAKKVIIKPMDEGSKSFACPITSLKALG